MEPLDRVISYHDVNGMDEIRKGAHNNDQKALRQAAEHFESVFMNMLLKSMRQAEDVLSDENSPFNSQSTKFYRDMSDNQLSMDLSKSGSLGLADLIVEQMSPQKGKYMPASALREDVFSNKGNIDSNDDKQGPLGLLTLDANLKQKQLLMPNESANQHNLLMPNAHENDRLNSLLTPEQRQNKSYQLDSFRAPAIARIDPTTKDKTGLDSLALSQPVNKNEVVNRDAEFGLEKNTFFKDKQDFVEQLLPVAKKVAKVLGIPPAAMVAQAALETGWGQKMIQNASGENANNFFGIKADQRWQGSDVAATTHEFKQGEMLQEKAKFRSYDDISQSFSDYVDFISKQDRYTEARKVAHSPENYFSELQKAGYATDPNYASKVMAVLKDAIFK